MTHNPIRLTALAASVLISAVALSGCSIASYIATSGANGSDAPSTSAVKSDPPSTMKIPESDPTPPTTTNDNSKSDELSIDASAFSDEELTRASQVIADYFTALRTGDYTSVCKLATDTGQTPPLIAEDDSDLKICELAVKSEAEGVDLSELTFTADQIQPQDIGNGFAEIYINGISIESNVVKLTNGEIYVDIASIT